MIFTRISLKKPYTKLLITDTDSLIHERKSEDVFKEFFKWRDLSDFGSYSKDSKIFDSTNKKVIGKMKDEISGFIIDEFAGLKSKMCSIKKNDGKESNTGKGINIATQFKEFEDVLFDKIIIRHRMRRIQAKNHKIGTYEIDISML